MSLLLDALRRAEQEKRARQETGAGSPATPAPTATAAEPPADLAPRPATLELEMVEVTASPGPATAPAAPAPAPSAPAPGPAAARAGAKAVFAAKQAAAEPASGRKRPLLLAGVAAIALAVAGGGFYLWQELNALAPKPAMVRSSPAPRPVTPAPAAGPEAKAEASGAATDKAAPAPEPRPAAPASAEPLVLALLRESAAAPPPAPLRLTRSLESPRVMQEVANGYDRLRRGDLPGARAAYEAAVATDPANVDAALGLATVAARSGDRAGASRHYRRVLDLDPRNATAAAGLAAIADLSQAPAIEAGLRNDLQRNPESAALHFTLGSLYASQGRWGEAQGAFFEAHRLDPANADILHNLAVSLDNLGQPRLAADYYRRALAGARGRPHQFDPGPVARRLAELAP